MTKYIEYLYKKIPDQYRFFKLAEVIVGKDNALQIVLLVQADKYDIYMKEDLKSLIEKQTGELLGEERFEIVYRKTVTDPSVVKTELIKYFYNNNPVITGQIRDEDIEISIDRDGIIAKLYTSKELKEYIISNCIIESASNFLEKRIYEEVEIAVEENKTVDYSIRKKINYTGNNDNKIRLINITQKSSLIGAIAKQPIYISDLEKIKDNVVICGKIYEIRKGISQKNGKPWVSFSLNDTTGAVKCFYMPRNKIKDNISDKLKNELSIVIQGSFLPPKDNEKGQWTVFIESIATCDINYSTITLELPYKEVPPDYLVIEPQKYQEEIQDSFFALTGSIDERLKGVFVVFDLETTGINTKEDKIIEIGAVKMIDGVLSETFQTFVNPGKDIHIPDEASHINNIYDEDVADAPLFSEVIPDFYKFCYGSTLVAHNSAFDVGMISYYARQHSYNFDQNVIDTLVMAKEVLHRSTGVSLDSLRKKFNIDTGKAHRALNDAVATAKLLKELLKI